MLGVVCSSSFFCDFAGREYRVVGGLFLSFIFIVVGFSFLLF